ncbi:hypothetical protein HAX54_028974, partial [Datura stramonium]|nr:hypothetical protein [Datura stramonium]
MGCLDFTPLFPKMRSGGLKTKKILQSSNPSPKSLRITRRERGLRGNYRPRNLRELGVLLSKLSRRGG